MSLKNRRFFSLVLLALFLGLVAFVNDALAGGGGGGGKGNSEEEKQTEAVLWNNFNNRNNPNR